MIDFDIRGYNPDTDWDDVEANLLQAGLHDPDRDTEERLRKYSDSILVAAVGERVVGSVYVVDHIVPMIFRLVVAEDMRSQGIGTQLLLESMARLRSLGHNDVELFISAADNPADADNELRWWYEDRGFEDGGSYRSLWQRFTTHDDRN